MKMCFELHVRYWQKQMGECTANVRFWEQSGHDFLHRICLLLTQSGHASSSAVVFAGTMLCHERG
jgi:hypothetical protein